MTKTITIETPKILGFNLISKELKYINNTKSLAFQLDDYDESIPAFQIVLEFFMDNGSVF